MDICSLSWVEDNIWKTEKVFTVKAKQPEIKIRNLTKCFLSLGRSLDNIWSWWSWKRWSLGKPGMKNPFRNHRERQSDVSIITAGFYKTKDLSIYLQRTRDAHHAWHVSDWSVVVIRPRTHLPHSCTWAEWQRSGSSPDSSSLPTQNHITSSAG